MSIRTIFKSKNHRVVEVSDCFYDLDDLKGECFSPQANPDIDATKLAKEEQEFENLVYNYGVYGYKLQVWNPATVIGWTHVNSCYGFVGQYNAKDERFNHYIVEELKLQIDNGA